MYGHKIKTHVVIQFMIVADSTKLSLSITSESGNLLLDALRKLSQLQKKLKRDYCNNAKEGLDISSNSVIAVLSGWSKLHYCREIHDMDKSKQPISPTNVYYNQ